MIVALFMILLGTSHYYFRERYWEFEVLSDNENPENFIMINLFNFCCLHKKVVTLSDAGCNLLNFCFFLFSSTVRVSVLNLCIGFIIPILKLKRSLRTFYYIIRSVIILIKIVELRAHKNSIWSTCFLLAFCLKYVWPKRNINRRNVFMYFVIITILIFCWKKRKRERNVMAISLSLFPFFPLLFVSMQYL